MWPVNRTVFAATATQVQLLIEKNTNYFEAVWITKELASLSNKTVSYTAAVSPEIVAEMLDQQHL